MNCKTAAPSSYKVFHWAELETTKPVPHRDWIKQCIQRQHEASVLLCLVWSYILSLHDDIEQTIEKRTKFQIQDKLGDVSATYGRGFMNLQNPVKTRRTCYRHTYSCSRRKTGFEENRSWEDDNIWYNTVMLFEKYSTGSLWQKRAIPMRSKLSMILQVDGYWWCGHILKLPLWFSDLSAAAAVVI